MTDSPRPRAVRVRSRWLPVLAAAAVAAALSVALRPEPYRPAPEDAARLARAEATAESAYQMMMMKVATPPK